MFIRNLVLLIHLFRVSCGVASGAHLDTVDKNPFDNPEEYRVKAAAEACSDRNPTANAPERLTSENLHSNTQT